MASVSIPSFGPLDPKDLEEFYVSEIIFNNSKIQIDLNFESDTIDPKRLETVKLFIENIRIYDLNNKRYIENDYNNEDGDTAKLYAEHHLEELGEDELASLIDPGSRSADHEKLLLKKLQLVRVGLFPDNLEQFAVFDYSLGQSITNYLLVIITDENGNLDYMTMES